MQYYDNLPLSCFENKLNFMNWRSNYFNTLFLKTEPYEMCDQPIVFFFYWHLKCDVFLCVIT